MFNIQFKIGLLFCGFHNAHYNDRMNTKMGKRVRTLDFTVVWTAKNDDSLAANAGQRFRCFSKLKLK